MNETLDKCLQNTRNLGERHPQIFKEMCSAYGGALYTFDLLTTAALKRSYTQCRGFELLVRNHNFLCAATVLRMQLDTAMRYFAGFLVDSPHDFAISYLKGQPIKNMKDRNGKNMTDGYLKQKLSEQYPWVENVYNQTSGFVHLSEKHFHSSVAETCDEERSIQFSISFDDSDVPISSYIEMVEAFNAATEIFFEYVGGWIFSKDNPHLLKSTSP